MCLYFLRVRSCDSHEVGGRRRKSAEEQCAEFQARARQTTIWAGRKEVQDIMQKFSDSVNAFLGLASEKGWRIKDSNKQRLARQGHQSRSDETLVPLE